MFHKDILYMPQLWAQKSPLAQTTQLGNNQTLEAQTPEWAKPPDQEEGTQISWYNIRNQYVNSENTTRILRPKHPTKYS